MNQSSFSRTWHLNNRPYVLNFDYLLSFGAGAESLAQVYLGINYLKAFHEFYNSGLCGELIANYMDQDPKEYSGKEGAAAMVHFFSGKTPVVMNGGVFNSLYRQVTDLSLEYSKGIFAVNKNQMRLISEYVAKKITSETASRSLDFNPDQLFKKILAANVSIRNPILWDYDFFGNGHPLHHDVRLWYVSALPEVKAFWESGIKHIKQGSFQEWWDIQGSLP